MFFKKYKALVSGAIFSLLATTSFAHLPGASSRSLMMGVQTGPQGQAISEMLGRGPRMQTGGFRSPAPWSPDIEYRGSHILGEGDTVIYGDFNGIPLIWWARFAADGDARPGQMAREGGTPPWVLINSLSAASNPTNIGGNVFQAVTWHGGSNTSNPPVSNIGSMQAIVPTWRDAASGTYSITLDDIGSMPFDISVQPAWDLLQREENRDIVMAWGVHVGSMSPNDWRSAIRMVVDGHEMFNHSIDHTSASDNWHIFWPGSRVTMTDPAVPPSVRGLEVLGTWRVHARSARGTLIGNRGQPFTGNNHFNFGPDAWNGTITPAMIQGTTDGSSFGNPATHMPNGSIWIDGEPDGGQPFTIIAQSEMVTIEWPAYWTGYDPSANIVWDDPRIRVTPNSTMTDPQTGRTLDIVPVRLAGGQTVYVAYRAFNPDAGEFTGHQEGFIAATGVQWFEEGALIDNFPHFYNGARIQTSWTGPVGNCTPTATTGCPTNGHPGWFITARDMGRPGFVAKLFTREGWDYNARRRNIDTANYIINRNIFEHITTAGEHFARGRRSSFYGYPFDIFDETLHDWLFKGVNEDKTNRFVGARGGAKSGQPMSGDFFHPFRIDFDAFYINNRDWTPQNSNEARFKVPFNPHVLLGLNEMVDEIVRTNGFMIRELHSVSVHSDLHPTVTPTGIPWYDANLPSDLWPINTQSWQGQRTGGWWGGITKAQMAHHFDHIRPLINDFRLTVMNPSEVVKYRMTRNAFQTNATLSQSGQNWNVALQRIAGAATVDPIHHEEISVIVNLGARVDSLAVSYDGTTTNTSDLNSPRRRPRAMNWVNGQGASIWSVSINPFATANHSALLIRNGEWFGQDVEYNIPDDDEIERPVGIGRTVQRQITAARFAGIRSGQVAVNLASAGNYTVELFNVQGRMIARTNISALAGVNMTGLRVDHLARNMLILQVRDARGASVLQHRFMLR